MSNKKIFSMIKTQDEIEFVKAVEQQINDGFEVINSFFQKSDDFRKTIYVAYLQKTINNEKTENKVKGDVVVNDTDITPEIKKTKKYKDKETL